MFFFAESNEELANNVIGFSFDIKVSFEQKQNQSNSEDLPVSRRNAPYPDERIKF